MYSDVYVERGRIGRMDVKLINLPKPSPLAEDYISSKATILDFFDYDYNNDLAYEKRANELKERLFKREALIDVLMTFNQSLNADSKVLSNIKRLSDPEAVVVVGGQQAGLLTGPIYTIHKCLAILHLAREQEEKLKVPVIPVFWIAGEDHDYAEVNHTYAYTENALRKFAFRIKESGKRSVSQLSFDIEALEEWLEGVFKAYGETDFTADLLKEVKAFARESDSIVTFFSHLINYFFGKYGLVLMDSQDPALRRLESTYFSEMIDKSRGIAKHVTEQLAKLKNAGYSVSLDQTEQSANLFIEEKDARLLLTHEDDLFLNRDNGVHKTKNDLLEIAEVSPHLLSNNVVTRPLMQDKVLPTLAFIAGPGEIAYWSALKPAFHHLDMLMPPVVPRFHLTLVDRKAEKWLLEKAFTLEDVLSGQVQRRKEVWLKAQHDWNLDDHFKTAQQTMWEAYLPFRQVAMEVHSELETMSDSNWERIENQLLYLKKQMERHIRLRHKVELDRFDALEAKLLPNGGPQERLWSIYAFLNQYGPDLVDQLMEGTYAYNGRQHVVFL